MAKIDCICPPKADGEPRHPDGDTVTLRPKLDFRSGLAARNEVIILKQEDEQATTADILALLTETYLVSGIESWSLVDEKGKPLPVSRANVRAFLEEHPEEAMVVGDEADGLYSEAVITPLLKRARAYSPPTPINGSTSVTNGSSPDRPKPSKRSSISTTPTDGTARMSASPAGVSN